MHADQQQRVETGERQRAEPGENQTTTKTEEATVDHASRVAGDQLKKGKDRKADLNP